MSYSLKQESITLSSHWFKKYKIPYIGLLLDISLLLILGIFSLKEYLIGNFDKCIPYDGLLFLLVVFILLVFRFNLSILVFSKQRLGIPLAVLFVLIIIYVEAKYAGVTSPLLVIFVSLINFFNKFFFPLPSLLSKALIIFLYLYSFYLPLAIYAYFLLFKVKLNDNAKKFDVFTGFYATTLSKQLRIMDIIVISLFIAISMWIGIISENLNWVFLVVAVSLYSVYEFCKRMHFSQEPSPKQKLITFLMGGVFVALIIYSQRIPYWGIIVFIASIIIMYLMILYCTKAYFKSFVIVMVSCVLIPVLAMGYNIFAYPQYGMVKRSIPFEKEKVFFVIKDDKGNLGIRNRAHRFIEPKYKKIEYNTKNYVMLLNQNNQWELFDLENHCFVVKDTETDISIPN